jgi:hypothetical protein
MTIIKPEQSFQKLGYIIGALVLVLAIAAGSLVAMYVKVVDTEHNIGTLKESIQTTEADSASMRDKTFALLDGNTFRALAEQRSLVEDRNPRYITIESAWSRVSRY